MQTQRRGGGPRESSWQVFLRCLAILRRVQQEKPAAWRDLVEAVRREVGKDAYGSASGKALHRRVENDLARIRRWLGVDIRYDRRARTYRIRKFRRPWIALPREDLQTLRRLRSASDPEVRALAERIALYLGPEARRG